MIFFFFKLKFQRPKINSPQKTQKRISEFLQALHSFLFFTLYGPSKSVPHSSTWCFFRSENIFTLVPMEKEWGTWGKYIDSPNQVNRKLFHQAGTFLVEPHTKFGPRAPFENLTPQNDWKKYLCKEYTKFCKLKQARATRHKFSPKKIGWQKVDLPRKKLRAPTFDKSKSEIQLHFRCQKKLRLK